MLRCVYVKLLSPGEVPNKVLILKVGAQETISLLSLTFTTDVVYDSAFRQEEAESCVKKVEVRPQNSPRANT